MPYHDVLAVILGGGRGSRLWPLTKLRAKPAVPIGGKYRLVDVPLSNCLNSQIQKIAVLTQFNSVSLHRHISQTYNFDFFHAGWVQILAAEQTFDSADWYQGTADAVRKQLFEIKSTDAKEVLILAGDHLYRMNYGHLIEYHRQMEADVTVAVKPVSITEASRFGILKLAASGLITDFIEKPQNEELLKGYKSRDDPELPYMGSMGLYIFRTDILVDLLSSTLDDFGGDVIPAAIESHRVVGYTFDDYWEDIGTMRAFYEANLALAQRDPPYHFHDAVSPVYTRPRFLPGSRIYNVDIDCVQLADGCRVEGAKLRNAIIGIRSIIAGGVQIEDSILMGADYYEEEARHAPKDGPPIGIGPNTIIRGAIVDKNARIGPDVRIEPFPPGTELFEEDWSVRDGIVVIPKNVVIPAGTNIKP